jgi:hypothetical protein
MAICRFNRDGEAIERWQDPDRLALFIQLGVIPPIGQQPGGQRACASQVQAQNHARGKQQWQHSQKPNKTR